MIKIILASSPCLYRDALALYLQEAESDACVVAADHMDAVIKIVSDTETDLVIADFALPGMNGMDGLRRIQALVPETPLALLVTGEESCDPDDARAAGVRGLFPRNVSGKTLLRAVYQILQGKDVLDDAAVAAAPPSPGPQDISSLPGRAARLTPREKQVLEFLMRGVANKDIAAALGLQLVTVKLHVRGICRKLGARNRIQAALLAQQGKSAVS